MTDLANATAIVNSLDTGLDGLEQAIGGLNAAVTHIRNEDTVADDTLPNILSLLSVLHGQVEAARVEWSALETGLMD